MASTHKRTCLLCGQTYSYCHRCNEYKDEPTWKYLYHDENCKEVADIWHAYKGNELTKAQAKAKLKEHDLTEILKYHSFAINELKDIMAEDKKPAKSESKKVIVKKDEEPKADAKVIVKK